MQRRQPLWAAAAVVALTVFVIFALIGDGSVPAPDAGPVRRYGHATVWALLAACFTVLAIGRGPRWLPHVLALAALGIYLGFLGTLLLGLPL